MSLPKFTSHMLSNQPDQTAYLLNKLAAGGGGGEGKLYNTTGQNTDGAMTQKATTNALGTKADAIAVGQALAGKVDKVVGKGLSTNDFTDADESKLTGIEAGAEVNVQSDWDQTDTDADDYIKNKPTIPPGVTLYNSTGQNTDGAMTQKATTDALEDKVDKIAGKGLSSNDFTNNDVSKLSGIESGAQVNVQSDWDQTDNTADDYIKNKPTIPPGVTLYNSTGQNTDGAMTQKATTDALALKVDTVSGKGLSSNDFTNADVSKLSGIEAGAEVNVQADWNQTDTTADDYIQNKPTIPAAQVNADWNAVSGVAEILNKPNIPSPYTLPPATTSTLGGIIVGNNLTVAADGTLSATGGGGALPSNLVYYNTPGTVTPVTPYVGTSDIVDGAVTEAKLDLSSLNFGNYSTSEVDTGFTWIDGSHIYKKTINFGALPNNTTKSVNHSISNFNFAIKIEGFAVSTNGNETLPLPLPSKSAASDSLEMSVTRTAVKISTSNSGYWSSTFPTSYVTLYYIKTS